MFLKGEKKRKFFSIEYFCGFFVGFGGFLMVFFGFWCREPEILEDWSDFEELVRREKEWEWGTVVVSS